MKLMRAKEAAEMLGIKADTVYALVRAGKLRCYRVGIGRGLILISQEQVDEYLASCVQGPPPEIPAPAPRPKLVLKHLKP